MSFGIPVRNGVMLGLTASTALTTRGGFPVPALSLNFLSGTLDSRITFTRALNTATRVNSSGFIETVNANLPRFDYDPVTFQPRGLLIEEQRTNLLTYSAQFDIASWAKGNASITADAEVSPDNTANADKLVENTANSTHRIFNNAAVTLTAGAVISYSIFAKAAERTSVRITDNDLVGATFDLSNGTITSTDAGTTSSITAFRNGWYRCTIACATSTANGRIIAAIVSGGSTTYTGDGTSGIYIYGAQIEAGAFPTSYIPTTTTSLTRNADVATMTGTNFSSWYSQSEGVFAVQFDSATISATGAAVYYAFGASDGTAANFNGTYVFQTTAFAATTVSSSNQVNITGGAVTVNTNQKIAYAYKVNNFAASLNAAAANIDTAGSIPTVNQLTIGALYSGSNIINGHIRTLAYFNTRLPNDRLQALTR